MDNKVEIVVGAQDNSKLDLAALQQRLKDMGRMLETARVNVKGDKEAEVAVERLALKLARLGRSAASPRIGLEGAARAEVDIAAVGLALDKLGDKATAASAKVGSSGSGLSGALSRMGKIAGGAGGVAAGALGLGLAGPLAAAGLAMGAFGAVAIPILSKVSQAQGKLTTAQAAYNKIVANEAIALGQAGLSAKQKASIEASFSKQKQQALNAEKQATAGLTDSQKGLMGQVGQLKSMWGQLENAMSPVVVGVASMALKLASALMPAMDKLVPAGAKVIDGFLTPLTALLASPFFAQFIDQMTQLAGQVAPILGQALTKLLVVFLQMFMQAGPAAVQVLGQLLPAIIDMASGLVPVVAAVTKVVAAVIGWLSANHLLIPALIAVGAAVAIASGGLTLIIPAIALVVGGIMHLWQTSQTFRNVLTEVFSVVGRIVLTFAEIWLTEWHIITTIMLTAVGVIINGAAAALGWVPGVGPALRKAADGFNSFKNGVNNVFNAAHAKIEGWKTDLANMPKVVRIEGDIRDLTSKLNNAKAQLRDKNLTATRRAAIQANIAQLQAAIAQARAALAAVNGTVAVTYVDTVTRHSSGTGPGGGRQLATGGIAGAAGGGPRGNLTLVGEHGRELVSLPPGSMVRSNPDTERMLGGGAQVVRLEVSGGASDFDQFLMHWFKERVRVHGGGSVQVAFGRG